MALLSTHKVITTRGIIPLSEVRVCDAILGQRHSYSKLEYLLTSQVVHSYSESMTLRTRQLNLTATPDNFPVMFDTMTSEGVVEADMIELLNTEKFRLSNASNGVVLTNSASYEDGLCAAFVGFFLGDGGYYLSRKGNVRCLYFHIKKARKKRYLENLLNSLGLKYRILYGNDFDSRYIIEDKGMIELVVGCLGREKKHIPAFLLNSNDETLYENLFEGLMESDGCRTSTRQIYTTSSEGLVNDFPALLTCMGRGFKISADKRTVGSDIQNTVYYIKICMLDTCFGRNTDFIGGTEAPFDSGLAQMTSIKTCTNEQPYFVVIDGQGQSVMIGCS